MWKFVFQFSCVYSNVQGSETTVKFKKEFNTSARTKELYRGNPDFMYLEVKQY